jgi:hypothetical protein
MRYAQRLMVIAAMPLVALAAGQSLAAQVAESVPTPTADPHEMPPEGTLVRFWARGFADRAWQFGRVDVISDSYQIFCPVVTNADADSLNYLVRGIDSLQVVDSAAAELGKPIYRYVDMAPIKARYGACGAHR